MINHQPRHTKKSGSFGALGLAILACSSCMTSSPPKSDLFVQQPIKKEQPAHDDFIAPDTLPELCSSHVQAHTIEDRLYWVSRELSPAKIQRGLASWYGGSFHGRLTANGEIYDMYALSAAHKSLPLPSLAVVTNLKNDQFVVVRVNDRGPFYKQRIIDLSYSAAHQIGMVDDGVVPVQVWPIGIPLEEEALLNYFSWSSPQPLSRMGRPQ